MKKTFILFAFLFISVICFSQQGVQTCIGFNLTGQVNAPVKQALFMPYFKATFPVSRFNPSFSINMVPKTKKIGWGIGLEFNLVNLKKD